MIISNTYCVYKWILFAQIHTDFTPFINHASWMKDEWFIGPIPEFTIIDTQTYLSRLVMFYCDIAFNDIRQNIHCLSVVILKEKSV